MNYLSKELAEEIVERTMSIIRHNINMMDENGVIIASGDRSRIGDEHAGAKDALAAEKVISITPEECSALTGTKPGVNLPIVFHDEIIGVIGITGPPSEVSRYGELVKMAAGANSRTGIFNKTADMGSKAPRRNGHPNDSGD
nr:sugar diacid recognition domain-containing protein [Bacillus licheniformis]